MGEQRTVPPAGPSRPDRVILHVDMDAFFVSVELLRRPELAGLPVVVGGTGPRGVIAAASYEARRYGVHSALPSVTARRRCPQAVFLPGDHDLYADVSAQVQRIFHTVTPLVEPLSLDEAFLDVTGSGRLLGDGRTIARLLRTRVLDETGLRCSVGVAPNKFLAKLASVAAKPRAAPDGVVPGRGVLVVEPGAELTFLHPLPVQAMWGVGPATLERLQRIGVRTVGDLARLGETTLISAVGRAHGRHLHLLASGIDDRPVEPHRAPKSIGHEETFPTDVHDALRLRRELSRLADGVASRLRAQGVVARTLTLKVRDGDFATITRSTTPATACDTAWAIVDHLGPLLSGIDPGQGVRLLGVSASNLSARAPDQTARQLQFDDLFADAGPGEVEGDGAGDGFGDGDGRRATGWQVAERTVDAIRERFGADVIGPGSAVDPGGLRVVRRGAQQWGPDA